MKNKEDKYYNELFDLLKTDLAETAKSNDIMALLKEVILTDVKNEDIINKLTEL